MHPNEQRLRKLFECLNASNVDGIMACYHPDQASFEDIAFRFNETRQIKSMWQFIVNFRDKEGMGSEIHANVTEAGAGERVGIAEVEEDYYYGEGSRRRKVHNSIVSTFKFQDGRIIRQKDDCDAVSWASQALGGVTGFIAGHIEPVRRVIAMRKVRRFLPQAFSSS